MSRPKTPLTPRVAAILEGAVAEAITARELGQRLGGVTRQRADQLLREHGYWQRWRDARDQKHAATPPPYTTRWLRSRKGRTQTAFANRLREEGYDIRLETRRPNGQFRETPRLWCDGVRVRVSMPRTPGFTSESRGGDFYHVQVQHRDAIYAVVLPDGRHLVFWPPYDCAGWIYIPASPRHKPGRPKRVLPRLEWIGPVEPGPQVRRAA